MLVCVCVCVLREQHLFPSNKALYVSSSEVSFVKKTYPDRSPYNYCPVSIRSQS